MENGRELNHQAELRIRCNKSAGLRIELRYLDFDQYVLKREKTFKWKLRGFSASNNSTTMHSVLLLPASKTHA